MVVFLLKLGEHQGNDLRREDHAGRCLEPGGLRPSLGCEVPATTNDHRSQIARRMQGIQPASMMHVTPCTCQRTVYSEGSELRALAVQFFAEGFQSSNSKLHCCWSDKLSGQSSFSHPKARRNATRVKETQADVPSKCNLW